MSYLELARKVTRELETRMATPIVEPKSAPELCVFEGCPSPDGLTLPEGVWLVGWQPKPAPVAITTFSVVIDVDKFVHTTLEQLRHALRGENWLAGHWTVRELTERLEQVGILVEVAT